MKNHCVGEWLPVLAACSGGGEVQPTMRPTEQRPC